MSWVNMLGIIIITIMSKVLSVEIMESFVKELHVKKSHAVDQSKPIISTVLFIK